MGHDRDTDLSRESNSWIETHEQQLGKVGFPANPTPECRNGSPHQPTGEQRWGRASSEGAARDDQISSKKQHSPTSKGGGDVCGRKWEEGGRAETYL